MATRNMADLGTRAVQFLDEEKRLLLAGKLQEVSDRVMQKQQLFEDLGRAHLDIPAHQLARIKRLADQNGVLMQAGMRGLRSVSNRIQDVIQTSRGLKTYGQDGQIQTETTVPGGFEKRA